MKPRSEVRGMTLLEVLVSLAIFAIAAIALSAAYLNTLGALRATAEIEQDSGDWRAVRFILLGESNPRKAERGGSMRLSDSRQIAWEVEILPTAVADLFEVILKGRIIEGSGDGRVHRETFRVLRPTWSQPEERAQLVSKARERRARGDHR